MVLSTLRYISSAKKQVNSAILKPDPFQPKETFDPFDCYLRGLRLYVHTESRMSEERAKGRREEGTNGFRILERCEVGEVGIFRESDEIEMVFREREMVKKVGFLE